MNSRTREYVPDNMGGDSKHPDLQHRAVENANRLAKQLRRHQHDIASIRPTDQEGGKVIADAVAAIDTVLHVLGLDPITDLDSADNAPNAKRTT
jgi:hypothetical protein